MKALLDTCIVVDLLQKREPFFKDAKDIFLCVANHRFEGFVSAKALTDIYYLMHRYTHSDAESRKALDNHLVKPMQTYFLHDIILLKKLEGGL